MLQVFTNVRKVFVFKGASKIEKYPECSTSAPRKF